MLDKQLFEKPSWRVPCSNRYLCIKFVYQISGLFTKNFALYFDLVLYYKNTRYCVNL